MRLKRLGVESLPLRGRIALNRLLDSWNYLCESLFRRSEILIGINVNGLDPGIYNYTILVSYETGNSNSETIIITVVPSGSNSSGVGMMMEIILLMSSMMIFSMTRRLGVRRHRATCSP